ncbi:HAMP domain-containing histidine kinase [Shewanella dokdonensis]|uniref:histidine kinase n=1 Tax=Shewanella dokdonensis TaxID=712036 RepID=A0ABX8DB67_9GAMM|nr:HAMP domain-containing sensor histidine kinase [Shewanella dokdonensis]QVK22001.1 HAMP domain-containing histidine kinase [Shewanella dokdonensis]
MKLHHLLLQLPKSMFGQMALLTLIFLGTFVYFMAIEPLMDVPDGSDDPMATTVSLVTSEMRQFLYDMKQNPHSAEKIKSYPAIAEVLASNPDFTYYLRQDNYVYSNTDTNHYMAQLKLEQLHQMISQQKNMHVCTYANYSTSLADEKKQVSVMYSYCDGANYYMEFSGITKPLQPKFYDLTDYYERWFWSNSRTSVYAAGGVFVIAILILLLNMRAIRRLVNLANSFDPKHLEQQLPETGLSQEVLPLVRAVNQMIAKVDDTQKQHNFFLSTAAHEMRTPLTILRTRLEVLDDSEIKEKLINDVRRLVNLVNQLLRLMRVGGPKELTQEVDLVACCKKVIAERTPYALDRSCTLSLDAQVPRYVIKGDDDLLQVALSNLIDNAISFTPEQGEIKVALTAAGCLTIEDQGSGIHPQLLDSLFEPFAKFPLTVMVMDWVWPLSKR